MSPETAEVAQPPAERPRQFGRIGFLTALARGLGRRCPRCDRGALLAGYIAMRPRCTSCGLDFEPYRADDAPAYFTILIVGHIVVPGLLVMEKTLHPETWVQMAVWLPATLLLTLAMLPFIKGATIAAIWASKQDG